MDFRAWIETVWPLPAVVRALEKAAENNVLTSCILLITCLMAVMLSWRSPSSGWHLNRASSSASPQFSASSRIKAHAVRLNEFVYELYKPLGTPSLQIVFFHGLQDRGSSDVHLSTWQSRDGSCIWPQTWLVEEFPGAHVLSVSYFEEIEHLGRRHSMRLLAENILSDLMAENVGQAAYCPVVLVGHSIGGQVVKQLCYDAYETLNISEGVKRAKLENFLGNIRGIFFYATPHRGIPRVEYLGKYLHLPLTDDFETLNSQSELLDYKFREMLKVHYDWLVVGFGETKPTKLGDFNSVIVPEASARFGDEFTSLVEEDHFSICRPWNKASPSFSKLREFLWTIEQRAKVQQLRDRVASRKKEEGSRGDRPKVDKQQVVDLFQQDEGDDDDWYDDPIVLDMMCDPVKCSDGRTYDRWTIVDNKLSKSPFDSSLTTFSILCDDITTRSRLFAAYPEQETKFRERRGKYREEALQHARADPIEFEDAIEKLNNVVKWEPLDVECNEMLDTVVSLASQQESVLNDIPVVNHEDVIGARLESEGARLVVFLGVGYFIVMFFFSMQC
ncbi:unnamed protein product [Calypogeia fissa]